MSKLKTIFSRFGVPETVIADNVPFASREFRSFARIWNFRIITSSPNYPQSNGQAERAIQTIKKLMRKAQESGEDIDKAILHLRATPVSGTNVSPAQLLFNRCIRTDLPAMSANIENTDDTQRQKLLRKQETEKKYADRGSRPLRTLSPGETVRIQHGKKLIPGRVLEELKGAPRTYKVATTEGQELRRTRLHLHQTLEKTPHVNITANQEDLATAIQQASRPCPESSESPPTLRSPPEPTKPQATTTPPPQPVPRRSTRIRRPPKRYSP